MHFCAINTIRKQIGFKLSFVYFYNKLNNTDETFRLKSIIRLCRL